MRSTILEKSGIIGFGLNRDEALVDWKINSYIHSDKLPEQYAERRAELSPWLPMPDMLHISSIGCIQYRDGELINTSNGLSTRITSYSLTQFFYLQVLLGMRLSFEDICIVCRDKINEFFSNISQDFIPIEEYPMIKLSNEFTGFNPTVTFVTDNELIFGYDDVEVGLKKSADNEDYFYSVQYTDKQQIIPLLSYIGYKVNVVVDDKEVFPL